MAGTKDPKILLIGTRRFGVHHARNLAQLLPKENVFIVDESEGVAASVAKQVGVPEQNAGMSWREFIDTVDCVDIVTRSDTHYSLAKTFLEVGKDVLVEKPMALTSREARELVDLASERSRILQPGHLYRFHPAMQWAKAQIDSGRLGDVHVVRAELGGFKRPRTDTGCAHSDGIHFYDLANLFYGSRPEKVLSRTIQYLPRGNATLDDWATVVLEYGDGRIAHVNTDYFYPGKRRQINVVGTKGAISINFDAKDACFYEQKHVPHDGRWKAVPENGSPVRADIVWSEPLKPELEAFLHAVTTREQPKVTGEQAYSLACIVEAIYRSSGERREVQAVY